jgi:predicted nucleotidyltransferase
MDISDHSRSVACECAAAIDSVRAVFLIGSAARHAYNSHTSDVDLLLALGDDCSLTELKTVIEVLNASTLRIDATLIRNSGLRDIRHPTRVEALVKPNGNVIWPKEPKRDALLPIQDAAECGLWIGGSDPHYKITQVPWDLLRQSIDYVFPFLRTHFKNPSLSLARAAYTYHHRSMCSKSDAGTWALSEFDPKFHEMIANDLSSYRVGSRYSCPDEMLRKMESMISETVRR